MHSTEIVITDSYNDARSKFRLYFLHVFHVVVLFTFFLVNELPTLQAPLPPPLLFPINLRVNKE